VESLEPRLAPSNQPILSGHYDPLLSGWNQHEDALTPSKVNDAGFGRLFNSPVDGYTYAQPLYVPNLMVVGSPHNVVFAATEHDSVYAFDADNGAQLWKRSLLTARTGFTVTTMPSGETFSGDIVPEVGITGTPVIDYNAGAGSGTMYVVGKTKETEDATGIGHYIQRLYALDITTGNNRATNGVVTIGDTTGDNNNTSSISVPGTGAGSVGGVLTFNARKEHQRMSLQLVTNADSTKTVYLAWASHGDNGPYHGWVVGFSAATLAVQKVFNTSPNGSASGIWESGGNLGVDAQNNLYFATGNGFGTGFNANGGPRALGASGGALGYGNGSGQTPQGITNSVAVAFRAFDHSSTGLGINGAFPGPNFDLGGSTGIDFNAGAQATPKHVFQVTLTYSGTTLTEIIKDLTASGMPMVTETYTNVNIAQTVGGGTAWVGFTGGTGGLNAQQDIQTWTYTPGTGSGIDHSTGFASNSDLTANGSAFFTGTAARLTPAANGAAGSIFSTAKVDITGFTTVFTFQMSAGSNPVADGLTFTIQNKAAGTELAESVLKLSTTGSGQNLSVADFFTPVDWKNLDNGDADLGSGGTLLLPDAVGSAAHPHLIVETGKTGRLYVLDRDHLGENVPTGTADQILQTIQLGGPGVWGNPAFLQDGPNTGLLFYWGTSVQGKAFRITNGVVNPNPVSQTSFTIGFPGSQPSISSNGTDGSTAIMWALRGDNFGQNGPETLLAFNAENLGQQLWSSNDVPSRDATGTSVKFVFPIVSNGHVYVGSNGFLTGYGLFPAHAAAPATPTNFQVMQLPPAQGGDTKLQLSWTNPTPNDATLIKIERSTAGAGGPFTQVAQVGGDQTMFTDMGLMPATHYWYRIRATNEKGDSPYTSVADAFTRLAAAKLGITNVTSVEVDLSWTAVANDHYNVERSTDNFMTFMTIAMNLPKTQTTFADTTVMRPNTYQYRVHAFNVTPADESLSNVGTAVVGPLNLNYPFPTGITSPAGLQFNGSAQFSTDEHLLRLNNDFGQAGSVFTTNRLGITKWTNTFWIRLHEGTQPNPADGLTFTLQAVAPTALGGAGGALGYQGIPKSVAIKLDVYNNEGETDNSTGLFFNGDFPGVPHAPGEVNVPLDAAVVNLRDQHRKRIDMSYDVATTTLNVTITDEQHDGGPTSVSQSYNVNIPAILGADSAYVGFTGGTGGLFSLQDVLGWVFPATRPGAPANVQATAGTMNDATVTWKPTTTDEDGFVIERSIDNFHFAQVGQVAFGVTTFHDTGLSPGIYYYRVRAVNTQGSSAASASAAATVGGTVARIDHATGFADHSDLQANGNATFVNPAPATGTIGIFTDHQDVGTPGDPLPAGSATFANGTYTLTASGTDIWDTADHMHYLYKAMSGDGEVVARVASLNNTDFWSKTGIMIRANTTAGSPNAFMLETGPNFGHNEPVFQWRDNQDGGSADFGNHVNGIQAAPVWLRLVRSGNTFTGFWAQDINSGQSHGPWNVIGNTHNVTMGTSVLVGLALTAHNNGTTATATFDHVSVTTAARLTDGGGGQASSIFTTARVPVTGGFTTSYLINIRPVTGSADGHAFVIQADPRGAAALGDGGGGIGYFGGANGIRNSIAIKFDLYSQGTHHATTGLFLNGNFDPTRQIDMSDAGIDFGQNHSYQIDLSYDGSTLTEKITDVVSKKSFSTGYNINLRALIGVDTAWVGFTGGTGGETSVQDIHSWTAEFNPFITPPHFIVASLPSPVRAGSVNTFTVTVRGPDGSIATGFRGTVHFSSTDPRAIVPDDYTFTAADAGQRTFGVVLFTAGNQSIIVSDPQGRIITEMQSVVVTPAAASSLVVTGFPSPVTAGTEGTFTVTVLDAFGNTVTGYTGTVSFFSSDGQAALPADYTFTAADQGTHTFSATLFTAGTQLLGAFDTANPSIAGEQDGIEVDPAAAVTLTVSGFPSPAHKRTLYDFTVTARDRFGNVATGYTGTVHFSSDARRATLPADYTFTAADQGVHTFQAAFLRKGVFLLAVTDTSDPTIAGVQTGIQVIGRRGGAGQDVASIIGADREFEEPPAHVDLRQPVRRGGASVNELTYSQVAKAEGPSAQPRLAFLPAGTATHEVLDNLFAANQDRLLLGAELDDTAWL
jgi:hypothetical protein